MDNWTDVSKIKKVQSKTPGFSGNQSVVQLVLFLFHDVDETKSKVQLFQMFSLSGSSSGEWHGANK